MLYDKSRIMIFEENSKAIYLQIADAISDAIASGEYAEEERLPSVREYAAQVQVNANTVMRAYEMLSQRSLIHNRRGIGYFVSSGARESIMRERGDRLRSDGLESTFSMLRHLGISPDELRGLYAAYLNRQNDN